MTLRGLIAATGMACLLFASQARIAGMKPVRQGGRAACCRKASSCPMHQPSASLSRSLGCPADANDSAVSAASVRAVLIGIVLPRPDDHRLASFHNAIHKPANWLAPPLAPPPRLV